MKKTFLDAALSQIIVFNAIFEKIAEEEYHEWVDEGFSADNLQKLRSSIYYKSELYCNALKNLH